MGIMKTQKFKNNNSANRHRSKRFKSDKPDLFFNGDLKRRKKIDEDIITSSDSDGYGGSDVAVEVEDDDAVKEFRALAAAMRGEGEGDAYEGDERGGKEAGDMDSLVARMLQEQQLEHSDRVRKSIASRVKKPKTTDGFQILVKHKQSVTSVVLSEDDSKGFSASKDGYIIHWDVETGKTEVYVWPSEQVLKSHGAKYPQDRAKKHNKHVLALAISSDGRYLASGGFNRHVHLWDTRTREHIHAFSGHKGPVSCLSFRQGTSELFSGSYDRTIKIWNAEDRTYMDTFFGHQSDVLTIDCLRKERMLSVGRDRTMHLWKVHGILILLHHWSAAVLLIMMNFCRGQMMEVLSIGV